MDHRIVEHSWLLLLLTWLHTTQPFPRPRAEIETNLRDPSDSKVQWLDKGNGLHLQISNNHQESNDDQLVSYELNYFDREPSSEEKSEREMNNEDTDRDIDRLIQEVFYPDSPTTISDISDILFPNEKLPLPKEIYTQKPKDTPFIYGGHSNFPGSKNYLNENILQSRYSPHVSNMFSKRKAAKRPINDLLNNILDLKDLDFNQISIKNAFLNKSESYNISEAGGDNNFLIEKKVNVSKHLKFLNDNNELANFTDFHSLILQEIVNNGNIKSFTGPTQQNNLFKHKHTAKKYGMNGNEVSGEQPKSNDIEGSQFMDQDVLLGAQYPASQTKEPYEDGLRRIPDDKISELDFVGGQFISYNNEFPSQPRTPQNNHKHIGVQPNDFVGGQFVGGEEIETGEFISKPVVINNTATHIDSSSLEKVSTMPADDVHEINNSELSSLSVFDMMQANDVEERSTESTQQHVSKNPTNKKITKGQNNIPSKMEPSQKFSKGISKPSSIFEQHINDEEGEVLEMGDSYSKDLHTFDTDLSSYTAIERGSNKTSSEEEITSTESSTLGTERFDYEDYSQERMVGSIIDFGNKVKDFSDEIQGQQSQISSNLMETTKETIGAVPVDGFSTDSDFHYTLQETSTQIVKDVFLYAGKEYENDLMDNRLGINEKKFNPGSEILMTTKEENTEENYQTEICFPLSNKKNITLFDILSGNLYLEKNGKKIALLMVKDPMTNCTSGTASCKLYVDVKNTSHSTQGDAHYGNNEENLILRNKRQSKPLILPFIESNSKQNLSGLIKKSIIEPFNLFQKTSNNSVLMPLLNNNTTIEGARAKLKMETYKEYSQPALSTQTTPISLERTRRSARASDSCSCSTLFKSTQIPSYKYFVNKRSNILTNIVVAAKHFMDS